MAEVMGINVSTADLKSLAEKMDERKRELRGHLDNIDIEMQNLREVWRSDASDEIRGKMQKIRERFFDKYDNVVSSYAQFLRDAAKIYEETETTATDNATLFH